MAAPLFEDEQRTQYRGFVDLLDIVAAVVAAAHQPATPTAGSAHALRARAPAAARLVATQPVGSIRAMDNDAQLVFQAQLGNSLLEVNGSRAGRPHMQSGWLGGWHTGQRTRASALGGILCVFSGQCAPCMPWLLLHP